MHAEISFETSRFRLFRFERRFDSTISPGNDVACWLKAHLQALNCEVEQVRPVGDLWGVDVRCEGGLYLIIIRVLAEEPGKAIRLKEDGEWAQWGLVLEKRESWIQRVMFWNRLQVRERLFRLIRELLEQQHDFSNIHIKGAGL